MKLEIKTKGHYDFIDITDKVRLLVEKSDIKDGAVLVFVPGSTASVTTMEYEEGIKKDLIKVFENIAPENADYEHHKKWGDRNGAAHIKSALMRTSLTVPVENGKLSLGTWQQIVLIDFDEKEREREITIKIVKE